MIARYGKAIERDLAGPRYRLDLAAEWRSRRWRRLLNLIDGLPRNSEYVQAITDDDEVAERMLDDPPPPGERVRMADWSPELEALHLAVDRLGDVMRAVVATIPKARVPKIPPMPRPRTAADRARTRRRVAKHRALVARVIRTEDAT